MAGVGAALIMVWGFSAPSAPREAALDANAILLRLAPDANQRILQDSKWGMVGRLQEGINARALECGVAPVKQDGLFGAATAEAARQIAACRGAPAEIEGAHLTVEAWNAITGQPAPDAIVRARTLARTMEATDYDRLEWNICVRFTGDQGSVLTWGPYGKTLGWGGEIMSVLKRIDPDTVRTVFAAENAKGADRLLALKTARELGSNSRHAYPGARALMASLCKQKGQMRAWERAFARLGAMPEVQAAYEDVAWGDSAWFRYVVERLSRSWREAGLEPTEVDFAFFIDRSIHMGWGEARFAAVNAALAEAKSCAAPGAFTNARARLAVADRVRAKAREEDRLSRDVMFLVDAEAELAVPMAASPTWPAAWKAMWARRAGISTADVGLSDARAAPGFDDHLRAVAESGIGEPRGTSRAGAP